MSINMDPLDQFIIDLENKGFIEDSDISSFNQIIDTIGEEFEVDNGALSEDNKPFTGEEEISFLFKINKAVGDNNSNTSVWDEMFVNLITDHLFKGGKFTEERQLFIVDLFKDTETMNKNEVELRERMIEFNAGVTPEITMPLYNIPAKEIV